MKVQKLIATSNHISSSSDWKSEFFVFPSYRFVAVYDVEKNAICKLLKGHKKIVTCVRELGGVLVSCGADGNVIVWKGWKSEWILKHHKKPVQRLAVHMQDDVAYICAASADETISVWKGDLKVGFELVHVIQFKHAMMEAMAISHLPGSKDVVLACGGIDCKIHLYSLSDSFDRLAVVQGHEDWIRDMDFVHFNNDLYLASASQDFRARIWKISTQTSSINEGEENLLKELGSSYSLSTSSSVISLSNGNQWFINLEAVLTGHTDWINSVCWSTSKDKIRLLTASMDRTMIIWEPEEGLWSSTARMGSFSGHQGLTGQMGYFSASFSPDGSFIISHGYHGNFHLWKNIKEGSWDPQYSITGHFNQVTDIQWDPKNQYFVSTSLDQTTRLFSKCNVDQSWHEIARPQIHGYDMNCFSFVKGQEHLIVSGGDEKILRVFSAPQVFVESLKNLSGIDSNLNVDRIHRASIPDIGLSNKGMESSTDTSAQKINDSGRETTGLVLPPFEEELLTQTLWPEQQKLYGHPNELVCITCSNDGKTIASSCRAKQPEDAHVRLWSTSTWDQKQAIPGHKLTVTMLEFSPDDEYLLSVSRDRHFILYRRDNGQYIPKLKQRSHDRIIWDCSWANNRIFATCSRDKKLNIYELPESGVIDPNKGIPVLFSKKFKTAVTAVEFVKFSQDLIFAVGFECGKIEIWKKVESDFKLFDTIDDQDCHCETVKRLRWREADGLELLSCSSDRSIRVFR